MTDDAGAAGTRPPAWSRVVIIGAATLAVLLVGATVGMLLTQTLRDEPPPSPGAGSVEVGFAQDMSVHHLQAVTMANWARDHSEDRRVRQLAFDIASTQLEQIGRMKGWLMLWDQPELPVGDHMAWMAEPGGHDHGAPAASEADAGSRVPMPGMATNEELTRLRSLSGTELDVYFLQLMLRHHQGGTEMARYARDHATVPAVVTLASSMLRTQGPEADLMRQMLAERDAQPLPFP
ncbi:Uncharacterized conserved protein, DUF305 family [Amycolatopsis arida]|uniref:Uncharacterized conserved protein, DUF305 family n=1 Tax=Amycolatopsis arida TaxID=587909 RepID=A0A1I5L9M1_9PSEU|nr:DUF305 domain-containing protein [Amycolatopsis arida]TDX93636.1 uncharacterized protein (DUF305 family) [Amycolatopsis arida]SFO93862.1 Uncharacterized conserved protein, DUF305 family [Amycolatopsis arida]